MKKFIFLLITISISISYKQILGPMTPLKHEQQKFIPDEEQWKSILKDIHHENIPIEIHMKNRGIAELYTNHVPASLYVKHSYDALKRSLQSYIEEFQDICHKTLGTSHKSFKTLQDDQMIIKLSLQQITQQLAFLNLRPISQVVHLLNTLVFTITMNFLHFVKSLKINHLSKFQAIQQSKDSLSNLCPDCKNNRQQALLKDLKRKLNLNKTQLLLVKQISAKNPQFYHQSKTDRQKQSEIINQIAKVKHQTQQNIRRQEERQSSWIQQEKKQQINDFKSKSNVIADQILMNEKQTYIKQINNLLKGRQVKETTDTNAYSYLVRELMEFPYLDRLHEETYAKQAQKITQKIQNQLLQNFMKSLSQPLRQVLRKVLSKKYMNETIQSNNQNCAEKVDQVSVEVQTPMIQFGQKIKSLEKQLQKKNSQLIIVKQNKQIIDKKYIEKYQEQRQNQRQIHQNFLKIKDLKQQIQYIKDQKEIQKQKFEKQLSYQIEMIKNCEQKYLKAMNQEKALNEMKFKEYREKINEEFEKRVRKITEKKQEDKIIKYQSELKLRPQTSLSQSFEAIQLRENSNSNLNKKTESTNQAVLIKKNYRIGSHSKNNSFALNSRSHRHALTMVDYTKEKIPQDQLEIKYDQITEFDQNIHLDFQDTINNKNNLTQIKNSYENKKLQDENNSNQIKNIIQNQENIRSSKGGSLRSIDMMIKFNRGKYIQNQRTLESQNFFFNSKTGQITYNNQKTQTLLDKNQNSLPHSQNIFKNEAPHQYSQKKNQKIALAIKTQKSSPNKQYSQRKFRKMHKQVQFSFVKKQRQEKLYRQNFNQSEKSDGNMAFEISQKSNRTIEYSGRSQKKQQTLKSAIKLKNINIEEKDNLLSLSRNINKVIKDAHKSTHKSTKQMKKYFIQCNQIQEKSSNISLENSQSYESLSDLKNFQEKQRQIQIWKPDNGKKQYDVELIKSIFEKEFQYFKLTGIIDKIYNLELNEQKNIRQKIISTAKKVVINGERKQSQRKTKDLFIRNHQTLKSILSQSIKKLYPVNKQNIDSTNRNQIKQLTESYLTQINKIKTFSNPVIEDLQVFGGKENAQKIEIQNFNEKSSILIVKNTINSIEDHRLIEYFQKLFYINREKYQMYTNFLKYPTSYLNGNISKIVKQPNKNIKNENKDLQSDLQLLQGIIKKLVDIHMKQHQSKCIHLHKFLKKIGYFRYMFDL